MLPFSINELALLPLIPTLLLRFPPTPLALAVRIALFLLMTGVSEKGKAILVSSALGIS